MAKLEFKQSELSNNLLPNLEDGIGHLVTAFDYLNSTAVPSSYFCKDNLVQVKDELNHIKNVLQSEYDRISSSIPKIAKAEEELEQMANSLLIAEISKRDNKF